MTDPTPQTTTPTRDEAARGYPNWPEYLMIRDTGLHDDQGGLGQRIYTTAGAGYKKVRYVREDLASAPAPASGGAEAGRITLFSALEAAYIRGAAWCAEMGMTHTFSELRKAAYDYADKEEKDVICREVSASLSPAATPVSEAEPVAWQVQFDDGNWSKAIYSEDEIKGFRQTIITDKRLLYALAKQTAKPASSPAGGEVRERALAAVEKLANTNISMSLSEWNEVSGAILAALSQSTSAGRVGE